MVDTSILKVGDRVGYCRCHMGTVIKHGFGTITKINGHGHITVARENWTGDVKYASIVFDKYGEERGNTRFGPWLLTAEDLQQQLDAQAAQREMNRKGKELEEELSRCKWAGHWNFSAEKKAKLIEMINNL